MWLHVTSRYNIVATSFYQNCMVSHVVTLWKLKKKIRKKLHVITWSYKNSNSNNKRGAVVTCSYMWKRRIACEYV